LQHLARYSNISHHTMLIGRIKEQETLQRALHSNESEMVAIIGRRRVGKTFLVRTILGDKIRFEATGVQNASRKEQLANFFFQLKSTFEELAPIKQPKTWQEAFHDLASCLRKSPDTQQNVLFFDELPWFASRKSGFLSALGYFWNTFAERNNIVMVICGSAASWMVQKVVNDRGGLHNRITKRIDLMPFDLNETEAFLKSRNINLGRYQTLELYMALGGIPHYLKFVENAKSATQNIEDICFAKSAPLKNEFLRLYPALFENSANHIAIVRALAQKPNGMSRQEIADETQLSEGGGLTLCLDELQQSGFIMSFPPFGKKKKESLFRLTDEYSLFYLKFIENQINQGNETWQELSQTQKYITWSGYAFEGICLKHLPQIKKALGISGIYTETSNFYVNGKKGQSGLQIDLLIDRKDQSINLFEMKFYKDTFSITKSDANALLNKKALFIEYAETRKHVFINILTTFGLVENQHSVGVVDKAFSMDILFEI
jgi:uncharacterized protein